MIKLSQAATAQKPASSNMAAQALCEPDPSDATKLIANFNTGFLSAISKRSRPVLAAISNIKYQEYALLIICPN
jgi:hypothetical protein